MKKQVKLYISEENAFKMKHIALYENNTISISYENAISEYIQEYESKHGTIKIDPPTEQ